MAVARMKKVTIIGHLSDREKAIEALQKLGTVQILDIKDSVSRDQSFGPSTQEVAANNTLEATLNRLAFCVSFLDRFQDKQKGLLESFIGSKIYLDKQHYQRVLEAFDAEALHERCLALDSKMVEFRNLRSRFAAQKEMLSPWAPMDVRIQDLVETESTEVYAATLTISDLAALEMVLQNAGAAVFRISQDTKQAYALFVVLKGDKEAHELLRAFSINRVSFGEITGSPRALLAGIEAEISRIDSDEIAVTGEAKALLSQYTDLLTIYDEYVATRSRSTITQSFARTEQVFALQGWVKAKEAEMTKNELSRATDVGFSIAFEDPAPGETPPVALDNNKYIEPFEMVTTIYGFPSYNETDPTPLLAPFFFVYFGLALSDAAYGIILALISIIAIKKLEIPWSHKKLFRLMIYCGISTLIFGSMLGSWFGNLYEMPTFAALKSVRNALFVFDPLQDPLRMLIISLALGIVQVWFGIFIKMLATIKQSGTVAGILDQGSWLTLLGSLVFLILTSAGVVSKSLAPIAGYLCWGGALFVVAAQGRGAQSLIAKPLLGLYGLYGIIGYFSDVLSYARLLALGLATGVIANVVNQIAMLVQPIPFLGPIIMIVVLLSGHTFNLAINILGSFIHAGRLQFVEFFTKFFEGGGRSFRPFRRDNKYTTVRG